MSSHRLEQIDSVIQQKLGEIFRRELEIPTEFMVTISRVVVSPDLRVGTVFVSVLPFAKSREALGFIIRKKGVIQKELAKANRGMKFVPRLIYRLDETEESAYGMERMIDDAMSTTGEEV